MSSSGKGRFLSWYKHGMTNLVAFQPPALRPHFRLLSFLSSCFKVFCTLKMILLLLHVTSSTSCDGILPLEV